MTMPSISSIPQMHQHPSWSLSARCPGEQGEETHSVPTAVGALGEEWDLQVRTLAVPRLWRVWLLVREIRLGILAAVIAALGAILSEVGAVLMVGGNLEGDTRVLTTAILMYTQRGDFGVAMGLSAVLLGLMLVLTGLLTAVQQGGRR